MTNKDDDRYPTDEDDDDERLRRTSEDSAFSFEHVEICPLEAQCNPQLDSESTRLPSSLASLTSRPLTSPTWRSCVYASRAASTASASTPTPPGGPLRRGVVRTRNGEALSFFSCPSYSPRSACESPPRRQPRARGFCQKIT